MGAQEQEMEALAALQASKRTVLEARKAMAETRLRRGNFWPAGGGPQARGTYGVKPYSRPHGHPTQRGGPPGQRKPLACFKCGGNHKMVDCPDRNGPPKAAPKVGAVAFAMGAYCGGAVTGIKDEEEADVKHCFLTQAEVQRGLGVIDCGATSSVGGSEACEVLSELRGPPALSFDDRPCYQFGGDHRRRALSRAIYEVQARDQTGSFGIHVIDSLMPILVGIDALKALGAIIDFGRGYAIFEKVAPGQVSELERGSTGHLLMDLGGDVAGKVKMSLKEYVDLLLKTADSAQGADGARQGH